MDHPNTLVNFSRSWQRATHFREPDFHADLHLDLDQTPAAVRERLLTPVSEEEVAWAGARPIPRSANSHGYGAIAVAPDRTASRRYSEPPGTRPPFFVVTDDGQAAPGDQRPLLREKADNVDVELHALGDSCDLGKSTVPMTIFNCTNMLIGVGILALPLGLQQCGWVVGLIMLTLPALVTMYTAKLLVRCLKTDAAAVTYGDIAYLAFGSMGRHFVEVLFAFELIAANVALVILFADSVRALTPMLTVSSWKAIVALTLVPLNFAPLRLLGVSSAVGIFCFVGILIILTATGLAHAEGPGSLLQPAETRMLPLDWSAVPATVGLYMAPWGGHSIVPAVYKDMRHPSKYGLALRYTYSITYSLAFLAAIFGYRMFGDQVLPEITSNILQIATNPPLVSVLMLVLVAFIPLTKIALTNRPVMDTINRKLGIHARSASAHSTPATLRPHPWGRLLVGAGCNLLQLALAIMVPKFDDVVALTGSALCVTICVILPAAFWLRISRHGGQETDMFDRVACWALIVVGVVCAIAGTLFAVWGGPHA